MENIISIVSDLLLLTAACGAAVYCMILSRRLARLNSVDKGLGGAIAVLSAQVDDLTKALSEARSGSEATAERLATLMAEAETMANDIEEMLSVSHDFMPPEPPEPEDTVEFGTRRNGSEPDAPEQPEMPVFRRRVVQEAAE